MYTITVNTNTTASSAKSYVTVSLKPADARAFYQLHISPSPIFRAITGPLPGGRRLIRPLTVMVEYDEEEVVVSEPRFHMHASAPTEAEALAAFRRILSGYLDSLTRREKTLGQQLHDQLDYLRSVIASE